MNKQRLIIDAHSHVGDEYYDNTGVSIEDYVEFARNIGVTMGLIMPMATPILPFYKNKDERKVLLTWRFVDNKFEYISESFDSNQLSNPYKVVNDYYSNIVREKSSRELRLFFVPLFHPLFDDDEYITSVLEEMQPVAVKIHCLGAGITPDQISEQKLEILKRHKIPVIVHCDYDNGRFSENEGMRYLRQRNSALAWGKLFDDNGIYGVLTHGALLEKKAFQLINNSKYLRLGIGPDLYLASDKNRLAICNDEEDEEYEKHGFLGIIKKYVIADKLLFDVDYNYCIDPASNGLDFFCVSRIRKLWNIEDCNKILFQNALDTFARLKP